MSRDPAALEERVAASDLAVWASRAERVERQTDSGGVPDLLETHEKEHKLADSLQDSRK